MKRLLYNKLLQWKSSKNRKPLILNGARQVGKTYLLKCFGKNEYESVAYISCDSNDKVAAIFSGDFDVRRIILELSAYSKVDIKPEKTLIILDEIQECNRALNSLKYFYEDAPEYHIAVAGSLLGISLHSGTSFPVGKVETLKLYPFSFEEFLLATGNELLYNLLNEEKENDLVGLHETYVDLLRKYFFVGGMPAAVKAFVEDGPNEVRRIQKQILSDYQHDFSKHAPSSEVPRINKVWESIPQQLAKENKKFVFSLLKKNGRSSEFEMAIEWLVDAGLVYKVNRVTTLQKPLKFYEESSVFKLFMLDIGLMHAMTDSSIIDIISGDSCFKEFKGAATELFVFSQMMPYGMPIYYYSSNDSKVEIDFVVQTPNRVIPVEVKAGENVKSKSLRTYVVVLHPELHLKGLRFSMKTYVDQEWMENYPLYMVNEISRK
ncbi:MAG: ATP-binding protein [Paludibacteraceae bacterium]|nr:ATP-binding protein [Paludibacteraceae bacterium]